MSDLTASPAASHEGLRRLAARFPHGLLRADATTFWFVTGTPSLGETDPDDPTLWTLRHLPSGVEAWRIHLSDPADAPCVAAAVHGGDRTRGGASSPSFGLLALEFRDAIAGRPTTWLKPTGIHMASALRREMPGADRGSTSLSCEAHMEAVLADAGNFLGILDPAALELAGRIGWTSLDAGDWAGVDATVDPSVPLRDAILSHPFAARTLLDAWRADANGFKATMARHGPGGLLEHLYAHHPDVPWWMRGSLGQSIDAYGALLRTRGTPHHLPAADHLRTALRPLEGLPASWRPRGGDWATYLDLHDVVEACSGGRHALGDPKLLGVRGRWGEWGDRLSRTAGVPAPGILHAVHDLEDPAAALASQVIVPAVGLVRGRAAALSLAGTDGRLGFRHATLDLAYRLIFDGLSLNARLDRSRRWHALQGRIQAGISALGRDRTRDDWDAGIPGLTVNGLTLRILSTEASLAEEGGSGVDASGMAGLGHCVGGYGPACRAGRTRIGSIEGCGVDGVRRRSSTVEFRIDDGSVTVVQHRGAGNGPAPRECVELLEEHRRRIVDGRLAVDHAALAAVEREPWSYDWWRPGHFEAVMGLWRPILPRRLRGLDPAGWTAAHEASTSPREPGP